MTNATNAEYVNQVNDIINGIARRSAYKFKTKNADELAQDLWVKVLEVDATSGPLDLNLVADICYKKVVDIQRYDMKRNTLSLDEILKYSMSSEDDKSQADQYTFEPLFQGKSPEYVTGEEFASQLTVKDLMEVFPEGSNERLFLEYWSTAAQVIDYDIRCSKYNETTLARLLGFTGTSHRGYKRFRSAMRDFVADYLDYRK